MDIICYPAVYPRRPPDDRDLIHNSIVWYFNAAHWDKSAREHPDRKAYCKSEADWCREKAVEKLAALPAHLQPVARELAIKLGVA